MHDNRGFMMAELIVVSAITLIALVNFYVSYMNLYVKYKERLSYYDVSSIYRLAYYRDIMIDSPNETEDDNLLNSVIGSARNKKIQEVYGYNNSAITGEIEQIDGYNDKVFILYNPQENLNSDTIDEILSNNGQDNMNLTFKRYIDYLEDAVAFKGSYVLISERCEKTNAEQCKYAYLEV